jgi:hypothetical protein
MHLKTRPSCLLFVAALSALPFALLAQETAASSKIWLGRQAEIEEYLRNAPVEKFEDIPIGVTKPRRGFFEPGGLVGSIAWKVLPPGRPKGFFESYKSEIAAYELDKLLGLEMVPVVVEKKIKWETGAAIMWVENVRGWKQVINLPKPPTFDREIVRMRMFDNLICNKDRNMGNLLFDQAWNLILIDHSRAFIENRDLAAEMPLIDRGLWERMLALDEPAVTAAIGKWVDRRGVRALLERRDRMKKAIDKMILERGEAGVFRW